MEATCWCEEVSVCGLTDFGIVCVWPQVSWSSSVWQWVWSASKGWTLDFTSGWMRKESSLGRWVKRTSSSHTTNPPSSCSPGSHSQQVWHSTHQNFFSYNTRQYWAIKNKFSGAIWESVCYQGSRRRQMGETVRQNKNVSFIESQTLRHILPCPAFFLPYEEINK